MEHSFYMEKYVIGLVSDGNIEEITKLLEQNVITERVRLV